MRKLECEDCHAINHVKTPERSGLTLWGVVICFQCGNNVRVAKVGDKVRFQDEFDEYQTGRVSRIVPRGEYSNKSTSLAIRMPRGFGAYVRLPEEVTILTEEAA